jgi:hypothetical protein
MGRQTKRPMCRRGAIQTARACARVGITRGITATTASAYSVRDAVVVAFLLIA